MGPREGVRGPLILAPCQLKGADCRHIYIIVPLYHHRRRYRRWCRWKQKKNITRMIHRCASITQL